MLISRIFNDRNVLSIYNELINVLLSYCDRFKLCASCDVEFKFVHLNLLQPFNKWFRCMSQDFFVLRIPAKVYKMLLSCAFICRKPTSIKVGATTCPCLLHKTYLWFHIEILCFNNSSNYSYNLKLMFCSF